MFDYSTVYILKLQNTFNFIGCRNQKNIVLVVASFLTYLNNLSFQLNAIVIIVE